jgi:hypothetical protein
MIFLLKFYHSDSFSDRFVTVFELKNDTIKTGFSLLTGWIWRDKKTAAPFVDLLPIKSRPRILSDLWPVSLFSVTSLIASSTSQSMYVIPSGDRRGLPTVSLILYFVIASLLAVVLG